MLDIVQGMFQDYLQQTNFEYETADTFLNPLPQDLERHEWHEKPFCRTEGMKFATPERIYNDLESVNEVVYNS